LFATSFFLGWLAVACSSGAPLSCDTLCTQLTTACPTDAGCLNECNFYHTRCTRMGQAAAFQRMLNCASHGIWCGDTCLPNIGAQLFDQQFGACACDESPIPSCSFVNGMLNFPRTTDLQRPRARARRHL